GRHRHQGLDPIGLMRRLVARSADDPREAHGKTRLMPGRLVDGLEGNLEDKASIDLANRAEAVDRVVAHVAVEPLELLISAAEVGLADGKQLLAFGPAAEGIIAVIA